MAVTRLTLLASRRSLNQWALLSQCYDKPPSKLPLMIRKDDKDSIIRCGLLPGISGYQKSSTFLGALLADVYALDQSWMNVLLNRRASSVKGPIKIQYGDQFDVQRNETMTTLAVPSSFLKDHKVEFLEVLEENAPDEDNCHFYLDLDGRSSTLYQRWPTISVNDTSKTSELPLSNEINSRQALEAILRFIHDKGTVNSYLKSLELSNFGNFSKRLAAKIDNRKQIYADLGFAVLKNLENEDNSLAKGHYLQSEKEEMLKDVERWRRNAHDELQGQVVPLIQKFLRTHLSIGKIYTYSNTKFNLRVKKFIEEPLRDLQMQNNLHELRGRLRLSTPLKTPLIDKQYFEKQISSVYKDVNKVINQSFFKLQLPLILCSTIGYISEQFSLYSMGSLASLGIVLGLQRVLSNWELAGKNVQKRIYEDIRATIEQEYKRLVQEVEDKCGKEETAQKHKLHLIRALSSEESRS
ncbi:hypothetical protein HG537_0D02050 [Torulaspora globosa]|uniref:Mmc1 C-terminal domain-containing protein n=1 Tax=Torulaspora globosa TaxID=48254 RepID=A0A7H9HR34_9SACH|nr:hypothetical protein HG537_0D02050 [Torulaspora sp. CBS 2947]